MKAKYNIFLEPDEHAKMKLSEGGLAKIYQKPAWLSSYLTKPYIVLEANFVVFGACVRGDVQGLLDIKCNVLAMEYDEKMFARLAFNLRNYEPKKETDAGINMSQLQAIMYSTAEP